MKIKEKYLEILFCVMIACSLIYVGYKVVTAEKSPYVKTTLKQ